MKSKLLDELSLFFLLICKLLKISFVYIYNESYLTLSVTCDQAIIFSIGPYTRLQVTLSVFFLFDACFLIEK